MTAPREQILGPAHHDATMSLNNLAELCYAQGLYKVAEPLYQRAITILEEALGGNHPDMATVRANYAAFLRQRKEGDH